MIRLERAALVLAHAFLALAPLHASAQSDWIDAFPFLANPPRTGNGWDSVAQRGGAVLREPLYPSDPLLRMSPDRGNCPSIDRVTQ